MLFAYCIKSVCLPNQDIQEEIRQLHLSRKYWEEIRAFYEVIVVTTWETSGSMFLFASSINHFPITKNSLFSSTVGLFISSNVEGG